MKRTNSSFGLLALAFLAPMQFLADAAPRQPWPPLPEIGKIYLERFDEPYHLPTNAIDPAVWVESWSGWALIREQAPLSPWVVPMIGVNTNLQVNPERGALRLWYRPAWSSSSTGLGSGPGGLARLLTIVSSNATQSVTYWSVAINATGDELDLLCEGQSGPTVCASGAISFVAGDWQLITCGYTETNSALFLNAQQIAAGNGVPTVSAEAAPYSALVIGSSLAGDEVAMGEIDEFAAFSGWNQLLERTAHEFGMSELWSIGNYWTNESARTVLGPSADAQPPVQGRRTKLAGGSPPPPGGVGPLLVLSGANCVTNGPILITNFVAWATNVSGLAATYVNFNVVGSNSPYSLYRSLNVSAPFASTNWLWLRYVNACDDVILTNEPPGGAYYRVASGPAKDSDGDGMPDDWEVLHGLNPSDPSDAAADPDGDGLSNLGEYQAGTDPHNPDSDYDGVCDGAEVYAEHPTNPTLPDDVAHILLGSWRFDDTNFVGLQLQAPIASTNLALLPGVMGNAVSVNSPNPAWLAYADTNGCVSSINFRKGSFRFWFKGAWNSGTDIGSAGSQPRLIEVGSKGSADGWFALTLDSKGTNLSLYTPTNASGGYKTNYSVPINWPSEWHQVVATWSPTNSSLYLDGVLKTNGTGTATWPDTTARAGGFRIGSDSAGANQAKGRFDNLETWNYELSSNEVASGYSGPPCPAGVDVLFLIDRSSWMCDSSPSNLTLAEWAATNLVTHLISNYDQAGLVTFTTNTATDQPLTNNLSVELQKITGISCSSVTSDCLSNAIPAAQAELLGSRHDDQALPVLVLISESKGGFHDSPTNNAVLAAAAAKSAGIKLVVLAIGRDSDTNFLKTLPSTASDYYYASIDDTSQLGNLWNSVSNAICRFTNQPPTVSITNPAPNATFTYPASIRIDAVASDPEDGLVRVDFYGGTNGTTWLATDYHQPFSVLWTGAPVGTNVLRAIAYDEFGASGTDSVSVSVVSIPPTVQFLTPTNGQLFVFSPTNVSITATASVAGASITNLSIYHGATLLGRTNNSFCQILWTNVPAGTNALSAIAADSLNRWATNNITITNNFVPTVTISTPTNYQEYRQVTNVTITATGSDSDGRVTNVTFYSPSRLPGVSASNSSIWSLTWTNPPNGTNFVTAVAVDDRGVSNSSTIRLFKMTPTNSPPTVAITFPASNAVFNAGANITITATATNYPATVTNVEFFANGNLLGSDSIYPFALTECCWKPGTYALVARASDSFGASAVSAPVEITVLKEIPGAGDGFWDPVFTAPDPVFLVTSMVQFKSKLYCSVGSDFQSTEHPLLQWDGTNWTSLNYDAATLPVLGVYALAADDSHLYAAGLSASNTVNVVQWDGTNWTWLGNELDMGLPVCSQETLRPVSLHVMGSDLYVGGMFTGIGGDTNMQAIARWNAAGPAWAPVGNGVDGFIFALGHVRDKLVIGGAFDNAGGNTNAHHIAMLEGNVWTNLGSGVAGNNYFGNESGVFTLATCGTNLFVGGDFTSAGGNTNARGIAIWSGSDWRSVAGGVERAWPSALNCDGNLADQLVFSISPHGDSIYVGGRFSSVSQANGESVSASALAKATWSEELQEWIWSDLDLGPFSGVDTYFGSGLASGEVFATQIVEGSAPGAYDVVAGGTFYWAGSSMTNNYVLQPIYYNSLARWRVGLGVSSNAPLVLMTAPSNYAALLLTNSPNDFLLTASVSSATNIASVEFYANGNLVGIDNTFAATSYTQHWTDPAPGAYVLKAVARDQNGLVGVSTPVLVTVSAISNSITANNDFFHVPESSPRVSLPVLANDTPTNGLLISQVLQARGSLGLAALSYDRKSIFYTPFPHTRGTERFAYAVTNASATNAAWVTVVIGARPVVEISTPMDGTHANTNSSVSITGSAFDYDGTVTNVALLIDGAQFGQTTSTNFGFTWSTNTTGFYTLIALATDNDGFSNASEPVTLVITNTSTATNNITATIDNLSNNIISSLTGLSSTNIPVIREGFFDLQGKARDSHAGESVTYQILLYRPEDNTDPDTGQFAVSFANVTPGPRDAVGFHIGGDNTNDLGLLDLSGIPNGRYDMLLIVHGGAGEAIASVRFQLASQLKIGQFSFSEQDLVLPVNGIPLTVTRTYNSLNPRSADFGYSWTYTLNSMDVELDDVRQDVTIGSPEAPFAGDEEDDNGLPKVVSIRTGGGWDVTLNLPDGRRTTFAFTPDFESFWANAKWTPSPDVHATLTPIGALADTIDYFPSLHWRDGGDNSTFDNHDVPGWILQTLDGTQYHITRGNVNNIVWDSTGSGNFVNVQAYGPPKLTSIVQRTGDTIQISDAGIAHYNPTNGLTRSALIDRDSQGRITAIWDPVSQLSAAFPSVRYVYNQDTGNLIQVLKLVDRSLGTYVTNTYHYDNPNFPHYITSAENPLGVPVARNEYDDDGRLTAVVDADGNRTEFIHSSTNRVERVVDRLGFTDTVAYDLRGNVTATTNALNGITLMAYDDLNNKTNEIAFLDGQPYATNRWVYDTNSLLVASFNPLGYSNVYTYTTNGQVLLSVNPRGYGFTNVYDDNTGNLTSSSDALGNTMTYRYNAFGLLVSSTDPLGTVTTNVYDGSGNLVAAAVLSVQSIFPPIGTIVTLLSSNSFGYNENGMRTSSIVWRHIGTNWIGATNTYVLDGRDRTIQTITPDGGTNLVVYDEAGNQSQTTDPRGYSTLFDYDNCGRLVQTSYPDQTTDSAAYDSNGRRTNTVDRLSRTNTYVFDALGRQVQFIAADNATNVTVYDDLGRVRFSIDAQGTTNAIGYDSASQCVSTTNAFGKTIQTFDLAGLDANGNQVTFTNAFNIVTTKTFDPLDRVVQTSYPDGTAAFMAYDSVGNRVAQVDQESNVTHYAYDGLRRLIAVTNALSAVTRYEYDEAGNKIHQIDALGRTNSFEYEASSRCSRHIRPGGQPEGFGYDLNGNLIRYTNFNGIIITNQFDEMNRLTNRISTNGYQVSFAYDAVGYRTNLTDPSGTTSYIHDNRDRLQQKTVSWKNGPSVTLTYSWDVNSRLKTASSSTPGGLTNFYEWDALGELTNVTANGAAAVSYRFDKLGNVQSVSLGNSVTNLSQYDSLNRVTNMLWNLNASTLASFYYRLGATGNPTNLDETVNTAQRTNFWSFDAINRLTKEVLYAPTGAGTNLYSFDAVGNRTNLTASIAGTQSRTNSFGPNDWISTDAYDSNGSTIWTTNSDTTFVGPYSYDAENRLIGISNGAVAFVYNGDGLRTTKTVGGTNTFFVFDDQNATGYPQVIEEITASAGVTNLSRVYVYGNELVLQRQPGVTTNYFVYDGNGNTRLFLNSTGGVAEAYAYDAYGTMVTGPASPATAHLYRGEHFDSNLGMHYLRARLAKSGTGRFWTRDDQSGNPQEPLSLHEYVYCEDNPVSQSDPSGHEVEGSLDIISVITTLAAEGTPKPQIEKVDFDTTEPLRIIEFVLLAEVSGAEAKGFDLDDALKGMDAMAAVIYNRTKHFEEGYPKTVEEVIKQATTTKNKKGEPEVHEQFKHFSKYDPTKEDSGLPHQVFINIDTWRQGANNLKGKYFGQERAVFIRAKDLAAKITKNGVEGPWPKHVLLNWKTKGSIKPGDRSIYVGTAGGNDFYEVSPKK